MYPQNVIFQGTRHILYIYTGINDIKNMLESLYSLRDVVY